MLLLASRTVWNGSLLVFQLTEFVSADGSNPASLGAMACW
jgi:hypothetical protein